MVDETVDETEGTEASYVEEQAELEAAETSAPSTAYKTELYKGNVLIVLEGKKKEDSKYDAPRIQFGLTKAKLVLANIDAIRAFVAHEESMKKNMKTNTYQKKFKAPKKD